MNTFKTISLFLLFIPLVASSRDEPNHYYDLERDEEISYYSEKNNYISKCISEKREGVKVKVNEAVSHLCKKNIFYDKKYGNIKRYKLEKKDGNILLSINICFTFKGDKAREKESFERIQGAQRCMKDFFAKQGINLKIGFYKKTDFFNRKICDHNINLRNSGTRPITANAYNWFSHKFNGITLSDARVCSLNLHELSHLLGLGDTYVDPNCPDRPKIGPLDDLMNSAWSSPGDLRLYQSQIKKILKPLCGE